MRYLALVLAFMALPCHALTPAERAEQLRKTIVATKTEKSAAAAEEVKLPTSRGFAQGATSLCWSYGFLNALETIDRVKNPQSTLELSRAFMQYHTMEDRVLRHVRGQGTHLRESGTPLDALMLARKHGLMAYADYRDIISEEMPSYYNAMVRALGGATSEAEQDLLLQTELERLFGVIPSTTHWQGRVVPLQELQQAVVGTEEWISYAPGTQEAYGPHADTDARREMQSFYTSKDKIKKHVIDSLKAGYPVAYAANGHVVLIYGVSLDRQGKALRFNIKDSYDPFFYTADANRVFRELLEVTMVKQ